MGAKAIEQEMYNYFTQLSDAEQQSVVQMIKTFLKGRKPVTERISLEQYNLELEEAMQRIDNGEFQTHEEVIKASEGWINGK